MLSFMAFSPFRRLERLGGVESLGDDVFAPGVEKTIQVMEQPLAMTGGGPSGASASLGYQLYNYGFVTQRVGHAMSLGYKVVTNNVKEFKRVSGLKVENWTEYISVLLDTSRKQNHLINKKSS